MGVGLKLKLKWRDLSTCQQSTWQNFLPWAGRHLPSSTCQLTVTPSVQLNERLPSPQHRRQVGFGAHSQNSHRRIGSYSTGKGENTCICFASSSFAPPPPGSSSGPGQWPGSPTHGYGHNSLHRRSSAPKRRLSTHLTRSAFL